MSPCSWTAPTWTARRAAPATSSTIARRASSSSATARFYAGFYYIADLTASDPLQQRYLDFLSHAGYIVRRRPVKVIRDQDTGERIIKGNLDTEIVLDLLRSRGKRVYVVTARGTLSRELSYVADKPIFFIDDHREALYREDRGVPRKNGG